MLSLILPIAVGVLLLMSALLSASETALFALVRMEDTREKLSGRVRAACERLMARPLEALLVIIGLNEACNIFAECLATALLLTWLGAIGAWIAAPAMLVAVLIFCDITPKTFALGYPGGVAKLTARPLHLAAQLAHPIVRWLVPSIEPPRPAPVSEQEFKALLRAGELVGEVEPQERELIHKVFDFGNRRVGEIMTPRERIFAIDLATPPDRLIAEVVRGHFSRVPIYRGTLDNIAGILHAKDLVTRSVGAAPPRLGRLIRPGYFVPPTKRLGELFDEMRRGRFQLALVVGEFGALRGLITLEDLLEELFGEISDEFDYEGPELTPAGLGEWLAVGAIDLARLRAAVGDQGSLAGVGAQTLNGLVLRTLKRVPQRGESFRLGDFQAHVERVRGATVELVRLRR
jgi:CBS domain containing-hemolysin-like protein